MTKNTLFLNTESQNNKRESERKGQDCLRTTAKKNKKCDWLSKNEDTGQRKREQKKREREIHDTEVYSHCKE